MDFNAECSECKVTAVVDEVVVDTSEDVAEVKPFKRDMVPFRHASMRLCRECGKFYVLSDSDTIHYVTKYNSIPLKCEACREKAREANPINPNVTIDE